MCRTASEGLGLFADGATNPKIRASFAYQWVPFAAPLKSRIARSIPLGSPKTRNLAPIDLTKVGASEKPQTERDIR